MQRDRHGERLMTNEEVIDKLQAYFLTQDPKVVARLCGNCIVDINRFLNLSIIPHKEAINLLNRWKENIEDVQEFLVSKNCDEKLKLFMTESEDE